MILINIYDFKSNVGMSEYSLFLCGVVIAFVLSVFGVEWSLFWFVGCFTGKAPSKNFQLSV